MSDNEKSKPEDTAASGVSRRQMLVGAGVGALSAGLATRVNAQAAAPDAPAAPSGEYVIDNLGIVSVDEEIGILQSGSIHLRAGEIVAVAETIDAPGVTRIDGTGMIAMPGMCDSHWHMWNSLFKNLVTPTQSYWSLKGKLAPHHTPEDYHAAVQLAATEALDAGITTVLNYAHNVRSPAHADAEIRAMMESGLRGQFSYGGFDPTPRNETIDLEDFRRIYAEYFSNDGLDDTGRLALSMSGRPTPPPHGVDRQPEDYATAFELGVPLVMHSGQTFKRTKSPADFKRNGFLNEKSIFIHGIMLTEEDRQVLKDNGASVSISFGNEFRSQLGGDIRQQAMQLKELGVNVTLSCDATPLNPTSLFEQMRIAFAVVCRHYETPTAEMEAITPMECLEWATLNGADALGFKAVSGSITPGKRADIVLVKADTLNMAPGSEHLDKMLVHSAMRHNVDTVIVDGEVKKWRGELVGIDAEEVREQAIRSLYDVRKRAGEDLAPLGDLPRI